MHDQLKQRARQRRDGFAVVGKIGPVELVDIDRTALAVRAGPPAAGNLGVVVAAVLFSPCQQRTHEIDVHARRRSKVDETAGWIAFRGLRKDRSESVHESAPAFFLWRRAEARGGAPSHGDRQRLFRKLAIGSRICRDEQPTDLVDRLAGVVLSDAVNGDHGRSRSLVLRTRVFLGHWRPGVSAWLAKGVLRVAGFF